MDYSNTTTNMHSFANSTAYNNTGVVNCSNDTRGSWPQPPSPTHELVFVCIGQLVAGIGLLANFLVIYIIARYPAMRTVPNVFVLNLAAADALYCCVTPLYTVYALHVDWILGNAMCNVYFIMEYVSAFCSVWFLTALSIERYKAVTDPIGHSQKISQKKAWVASVVVWFFGLVAASPTLVFVKTAVHAFSCESGGKIHHVTQCDVLAPEGIPEELLNKLRGMYGFTITFVVPLCIIIPLYVIIWRKLREKKPSTLSMHLIRSRNRVTRMVAAVVVFFVIALLPWHTYWILQYFSLIQNVPHGLYDACLALYVANSAVNPFFYALMGDKFRRYINIVFCRWRLCRNNTRQKRRVRKEFNIQFGSPQSETVVPHDTRL
ncbi:neuropeptides B/W receptor type 1-like [Branchiostoma floridae]|uniref:Neuropeptides B/W receptor type 1-like n=2 Tax=Branchiostoma floridae TaxID=7739 RepID=A0A9J7M4Q2_BRAFL|nr:neuropeptides B/W receptor type 1-like [Branchiostoma floridae]